MKHIGIHKPCSEDWSKMSPTEKGAFCQKCAMEVHDFTNKTSLEIKLAMRNSIGQRLCGRMSSEQEDQLSQEFETWRLNNRQNVQRAMTFSLIVVFGLTLFSCSSPQEEMLIQQIQRAVAEELQTEELDGRFYSLETLDIEEVEPVVPFPSIDDSGMYIEEVTKEYDMGEVRVYEERIDYDSYVLGGAMMITHEVESFLVETTPEPEELDVYGNPYPTEFNSKVFPNPMNTRAAYELQVPEKGIMVVGLYDMKGRLISVLNEGELDRGTHEFTLNMLDEQPGTYLVVVRSKQYSQSTKFIKR